jgi:hypothetical protein
MTSRDARRAKAATAGGLGLGGLLFALVLFDFRFDPLRTASKQGFLSNFFDMQARALLDGHLAIPDGAAGIEGFVVDGRTYIYFPPFPALLRIPVQLVTHEFDGRLTLLSMALGWIVFAAMSTKLLWFLRSTLRGNVPLGRLEATAAAFLLAAVTGGTVLTYDASLPWVYHEVYLWCSSMSVGAAYWLTRVLVDRSLRDCRWLGAFVLGAMMTRTTGGWALALATIGGGVWLMLRDRRTGRRLGLAMLAAGAAPLAAGITLNMVKFGHPYMFPLQNQVWSELNAHRREALAVNGGTITGPQFLLTSLVNYFRPDGIRFVEYFPWITLPAEAAKPYGGAFLDQTYRTGSITAFMPLLSVLTVVGLVALFRPRSPRSRRPLRWPALGVLAVTGGVMGYGYLANRYTSDFVPGLVFCGIVGFWVSVAWMDGRHRWLGRAAVGLVAALSMFSLAAQVAIGSATAAQLWRGDRLVSYVALQNRVSGGAGSAFASLVHRTDRLPEGGRTDQLAVVGDCEALFQHTGDRYEPWLLVQQRDMVSRVLATSQGTRSGLVRLVRQTSVEQRYISLEFLDDGRARLVIEDEDGNFYSQAFGFANGQRLTVTVHALPEFGQARVRVNDNPLLDLYVPLQEWDKDWYSDNSRFTFADPPPKQRGVAVLQTWGKVPELCGKLVTDAASGAARPGTAGP